MSINTPPITLIGRVISEIDTRVVSDGVKVANFRLLSQERFYDKKQDAWVDGDRLYVRVACWRRLAENVAESLRQGDHVVVYGPLKVRRFEAEGGGQGMSVEVEAKVVAADLTLHTVMVNRPDWVISPNQQTLVNPPPVEPAPDAREEVAQAA